MGSYAGLLLNAVARKYCDYGKSNTGKPKRNRSKNKSAKKARKSNR